MNALILVDLQNDFLDGGASPLPGANALIPIANQLQSVFKLVVATQEWHPANHKSFAANHPGRHPGETILLKKQPQWLWPPHCIQNTRGAQFAPALKFTGVNKVFRQGTDAELDNYSAFFDQGHTRSTGLSDYLKEKRADQLYLMGLPTEHAVKFTALDALALGFKTFVIEDACRGWNRNSDDVAHAIDEMKKAGVGFLHSGELL